jgi:hypothetical protein
MLRALLFLLLALVVNGCGPYDAKKPAELAECFRLEFEKQPPEGVTVRKARIMGIRDWSAQWLLIEAQGKALESVLSTNFTKETFPPAGFSGRKDKYTPDWWALPPADQLEFYIATNWPRGSWSHSSAAVAVQRANGTIYFRGERID